MTPGLTPADISRYITKGLIQTPSIMPWYCSGPSFVTDRFESCVPNSDQQVAMFRAGFGPNADPKLVDSAASQIKAGLVSSGYDESIQQLEQQARENNLPNFMDRLGLSNMGLPDLSFNGDLAGLITPIAIGVGVIIAIKLVKGR